MAAITKRPHRLSDGRDLIYYDDADSALDPGRAPDLREPAPRPATATMRQDPLTGEWISIAAARQNRVMLPPAELDPLAPATPGNPSEIPSLYDVAVFENKSPSFGPLLDDPNQPEGLADLAAVGLGRTRTSVGRCEVVCFSPEHAGSFGTQSVTRARTVIEAWADRTAALSALPGIEQVFPFENRGEAIGVTLPHPHGQIYAYPNVTPRTQRLLDSIHRTVPDLMARVLDSERASERVVLQGDLRKLRAGSPDRYLRVDVAVEDGWLDSTLAVVVDRSAAGTRLRLRPGADAGTVLDAIRANAAVQDFGVETPSLAELFLDATGHWVEQV